MRSIVVKQPATAQKRPPRITLVWSRSLEEYKQIQRIKIMYIYWRVQQDLSEMGNTIIFHQPNLIWAFKKWCKKNAAGLTVAEDLSPEGILLVPPSLN